MIIQITNIQVKGQIQKDKNIVTVTVTKSDWFCCNIFDPQ